jgi:hypothetical protein
VSGVLKIAAVALASGAAGWAIENVGSEPPRYSQVLGGSKARIPLLPVYAAGGALVAILEPSIREEPWLLRFLVYGATLAALEGVSGIADQELHGRAAWSYDGAPVDLTHAAAWAALAAAAEPVLRKTLR